MPTDVNKVRTAEIHTNGTMVDAMTKPIATGATPATKVLGRAALDPNRQQRTLGRHWAHRRELPGWTLPERCCTSSEQSENSDEGL